MDDSAQLQMELTLTPSGEYSRAMCEFDSPNYFSAAFLGSFTESATRSEVLRLDDFGDNMIQLLYTFEGPSMSIAIHSYSTSSMNIYVVCVTLLVAWSSSSS